MGKLMVINGSPRGRRSNSRRYAEAMLSVWQDEYVEYYTASRRVDECIMAMDGCSDVLLAFPLYTDGLPSGLMELLGQLLEAELANGIRVHAVINCGFKEPSQCDAALEMVRLFCKRAGCKYGAGLKIGCGEAFPGTPLMRMAEHRLRRFAREIARGRSPQWTLSMPLTKGMFIRAADAFWLRRSGNMTRQQLEAARVITVDKDQLNAE